MFTGCYTALITPFKNGKIDYEGLDLLVEFQIANGISGIVAVGTTAESPTLSWEDHNRIIEIIAQKTRKRCTCIAGTGSNNTKETLAGTRHAVSVGAQAVLLIDPYYNGPSSLEIRREYVSPVAKAFPQIEVIPYVLPGRTGTQLLPEDLALLHRDHQNVNTVKEATGNLDNMAKTRACCGPDFSILSGDDPMTFAMMTDNRIKAAGVISVASNFAPDATARMVAAVAEGNATEGDRLLAALEPLFDIITVKTRETTPYGEVECRARNPLPTKALMTVLGMPSGECRQPLGKMTRKGLEKVLDAARAVQATAPEVFNPVADFFKVDIDERLNERHFRKGLYYEEY